MYLENASENIDMVVIYKSDVRIDRRVRGSTRAAFFYSYYVD